MWNPTLALNSQPRDENLKGVRVKRSTYESLRHPNNIMILRNTLLKDTFWDFYKIGNDLGKLRMAYGRLDGSLV